MTNCSQQDQAQHQVFDILKFSFPYKLFELRYPLPPCKIAVEMADPKDTFESLLEKLKALPCPDAESLNGAPLLFSIMETALAAIKPGRYLAGTPAEEEEYKALHPLEDLSEEETDQDDSDEEEEEEEKDDKGLTDLNKPTKNAKTVDGKSVGDQPDPEADEEIGSQDTDESADSDASASFDHRNPARDFFIIPRPPGENIMGVPIHEYIGKEWLDHIVSHAFYTV